MTISGPEPDRAAAPESQGGRLRSLRESFRRSWEVLKGGAQSPLRSSLALGLGLAVALAVPPPFQTPAALGLALLCRLNGLIALAGTLIWQPFTAPFILLLQRRVGTWILPPPAGVPPKGLWHPWIKPILAGAPVTALAAGLLGAAICYLLMAAWRSLRRPPRQPSGGHP